MLHETLSDSFKVFVGGLGSFAGFSGESAGAIAALATALFMVVSAWEKISRMRRARRDRALFRERMRLPRE